MKHRYGFALVVPVLLSIAGAFLSAQESPAQKPTTPTKKVMIIPIDGEIDDSQAALIRRATDRAKKEKADLVIFEINTPGGEGEAMLSICDQISNLAPIPTVAFVRRSESSPYDAAYSAGAFIAFSCKKIYMDPQSVIGAAAPIMMGPGGIVELPEKFISAFRKKMAAIAEVNGYPKNLAMAMVDKNWNETFKIEVNGERKYWTKAEVEEYERDHPGVMIDVPIYPVQTKGQLLTATATEALQYGIVTRIITQRSEIYSDYGITNPIEIKEAFTWSEGLVGWLTDGTVRFILIAVGILGIWVEMKTPGFGVPGVVGILAFAVVLFGHYLAGLAEAPEIGLVILGLLLIVVELFVIPGTGLFAVGGILCFFVGLILSLSFQGFSWPQGDFAWESLQGPAFTVFGSFILASLVVFALLRFLPHVPVFSRMALQTEITSTSADAPEVHMPKDLVSKRGVSITDLRPAGKVEIGGTTMDVTTRGEFIEKGEAICIIQVEGNRIVVSRPGIS